MMSDHEEIIDLDINASTDSCFNTYSSENNKSQSVKFLKLGSISLDDKQPTFKPIPVKQDNPVRIQNPQEDIGPQLKGKKQIIEIIDNNGWNEKNEKLLAYWKEESHIIIWLNTQALNELKFINKALSIPAILISAISSATLFSNFNTNNNSERVDYTLLVIGILLIISTFIQSLKEFLNLEKNIRQHINIIKTNQMLILDIQEQLNQEVHDRANGKEFLSKIKLKKADMVRNNVEIPPKIYKKMERAIENGDIINYDETFILYSYLQNKMTNHSIMNPHDVGANPGDLLGFKQKPLMRERTGETRIDIPYKDGQISQFERDKAIVEPYENLDKIREKVNRFNRKDDGDDNSIGSQGSANSVFSEGSINNIPDLQFDKKKKKGKSKRDFQTSANDYVQQIKTQIARL